jgi:hypothetical protein
VEVLQSEEEVLQFEAAVLPTHTRLTGVQCRPEEFRVMDFVDASLMELRWRQAEALHEHLVTTHIRNHVSSWWYHRSYLHCRRRSGCGEASRMGASASAAGGLAVVRSTTCIVQGHVE